MRRRRAAQPESLTSLLDVLFIIVFASLVQLATSGGTERAAAVAPEPVAPVAIDAGAETVDAAPLPPAGRVVLRERALSALARELEGRRVVVARVSADGTLRLLEHEGGTTALGMPLLERVPDPDVALAYLGDRSAELRVCRVITLHLGRRDLRGELVVIAPDAALTDLTVALVSGLRRDAARCLEEQQGVAVVVDAMAVPAPAEEP